MATKRRFKFNSIVISRATVAGGKNVYPGELLTIYGEEPDVTEEEVLVLLSRGAAKAGTEENIAAIKKAAEAAKKVTAGLAEKKARSEKASHKLATEALERVEVLELRVAEVIDDLEQRVDELDTALASLSAQLNPSNEAEAQLAGDKG